MIYKIRENYDFLREKATKGMTVLSLWEPFFDSFKNQEGKYEQWKV